MPTPGPIPALRVPPAETQVDGLPPALSLAARALCQNFLSDLNDVFAQRRCLRVKLKRYEPLEVILYDRYGQQLSNAVPRSSFYGILGVESMTSLNFKHVKNFKTSQIDSKAPGRSLRMLYSTGKPSWSPSMRFLQILIPRKFVKFQILR